MDRSLRLVIVAMAALSVAELSVLSVTRLRQFTYDSMNYVTVARNAWDGLGLVQSASGFNEPVWNPDGPLRPPMTSQPPVFPLVIGGLHALGLSFSTAALVASVAGYACMLILLSAIARRLYDADVASIALVLGLVSLPVRDLGVVAWSESIALSASLGSLLLLIAGDRRSTASLSPGSEDPGLRAASAGAAGFLAGLAFATRYAFAPAALIGLILLVRTARPRRRGTAALAFMAAFLAVAALVIGRNYTLDGTLFGPARLASTTGWLENTRQVVEQAFGTYLGGPHVRLGWTALGSGGAPEAPLQVVAFAACAVVVLLVIARRERSGGRREIAELLFAEGRWLLPAWSASYLAFLIWQRSLVHFDVIDTRLVAPGLVFLLPAAAALLSRAFTDARGALVLAVSLSVVVVVDQARLFPATRLRSRIEGTRSERLQWIADRTSAADLIVGDDTVDIPFVHPDRVVVSFSPYPYSERLEFDRAAGWICARAAGFRNVYVIVRRHVAEPAYGRFAADVASAQVERYRGLTTIATLEDAVVARLSCGSR